jgi:hypothetical protein
MRLRDLEVLEKVSNRQRFAQRYPSLRVAGAYTMKG